MDLDVRKHTKQNKQSVSRKHFATFLLSRGRRSQVFFTEDSQRYKTPKDELMQLRSYSRVRYGRCFDGVSSRFEYTQSQSLYSNSIPFSTWEIRRSVLRLRTRIVDSTSGISFSLSPMRAWNFSVVGAVLFGMLSMNIIAKSFGQTASAQRDIDASIANERIAMLSESEGEVLGEAIEFIQKGEAKDLEIQQKERERIESQQMQQEEVEYKRRMEFEQQIKKMVSGYPIEQMLPAIFKQDEIVSAYLIAIAKKESNWGRRVPVLNGEDCFNYWGYRAKRERMGSGGHTCFDSPEDAVETVGARLSWFIHQKNRETPEDLIVWKCGFSCDGHSSYSVKKWIDDVDLYFSKLYTKEE